MSVIMLVAGAMLAQATPVVVMTPTDTHRVDVGYEQLAHGKPSAAIAAIENNRELSSNDPVALINLGAAHAMLGDRDAARSAYLAAIASADRYDVQLGNGSWMDSRQVARNAMQKLERGQILAVR